MAQTPQAELPNRPARRRAGISIHYIAGHICSAARRKVHGGKMTRTKSRRRFPSDGCPGPLGDPLVCTPFLDDGMIRVQLNQASPRRNARPGIPALSPQPRAAAQTLARRCEPKLAKPHLPARLLARSRTRPLHRRQTEAPGRVEEAIVGRQNKTTNGCNLSKFV